jgi:Xaa-Pro aminopeptidase
VDRKLAKAQLGLEETASLPTVKTARALAAALPDARIGDCSGIIETLRLVKSPSEIAD